MKLIGFSAMCNKDPQELCRDSIVNQVFLKSPEYSNYDFRRIQRLTWFSHRFDHRETDPSEDQVCVYDHQMLDQPVRRREILIDETDAEVGETAAQYGVISIPETGHISPYTSWTGSIDEDHIQTCLENIADALIEHDGVKTEEGFLGRITHGVEQMMERPEWQDRDMEVFCHVIDDHAEIVDQTEVERYRSPSQRNSQWIQRHKEESNEFVQVGDIMMKKTERDNRTRERLNEKRVEMTREQMNERSSI